MLFLGLSWQAYDGGARQANVREADFAAARTREEIADLQRQLEVQVEQAYRDYTQAIQEASTAETNVKAAEENLRIEEDQYKAGLSRTIDVLDAEAVLAVHRVGEALDEGSAEALPKAPVRARVAGEERRQGGVRLRDVVLHPLLLFSDRRPVAAGDEVEDHAQHGHEQERERPGERVRGLAVFHDERDHDVQPQDDVRHHDPPGDEVEPVHADLTFLRRRSGP